MFFWPVNYQVILPDTGCFNEPYIFDEISYKYENNVSNESIRDRKSDAILVGAGFSNDSLFSNQILNKIEENISEQSNPDVVILNVICQHNVFVSGGKLVQREARFLNELELNYSSDDFISSVVYSSNAVSSSGFFSKCKKYASNKATSFLTWVYEDLTVSWGRIMSENQNYLF
ncbi:unnamed protein product [Schistosoma curassoni]|nr:unnamed protein product [Schistosoma curassoni]